MTLPHYIRRQASQHMIKYLFRLLYAYHMNVGYTTVIVKVVTVPVQRRYLTYKKTTLAYYIKRQNKHD